MVVNLTEMKGGQTGVVVNIEGGLGARDRIQSMGIRIGKRIKKEGPRFGRGPQTVLIGNLRIAVGFGMASKILVQIDKYEAK